MTLLDLRPTADTPADEARLLTHPFGQPVSSVFADLLPDEVRTKRRVRYLKRRMLFGLVALALIIGLGDTLARQQTEAASGDLAHANLRITALNQQAARFGQVISVQADTQQITSLLTQAMSGDVPWAGLTSTLQKVAPRGLALTGVDGTAGAGDGSAAPPATGATGATGPVVIGSLSLTGTATGYQAVADYVSALVKVPGIVGVTPQTTATSGTAGRSLTFTITAALTTAAEGGRYAPRSTAAPATGTTPATGVAAAPTTTPPVTTPAVATPAVATPAVATPAVTTPAAAPSGAAAPVGN